MSIKLINEAFERKFKQLVEEDEKTAKTTGNGIETIYEDETWKVIVPKTKEAYDKLKLEYGPWAPWPAFRTLAAEGPINVIVKKNGERNHRYTNFLVQFETDTFMDGMEHLTLRDLLGSKYLYKIFDKLYRDKLSPVHQKILDSKISYADNPVFEYTGGRIPEHLCSTIEKIIIKDGVKVIESGAFSGCYSLKDIVIPSSIQRIPDRAFAYCSSLKNITLPNSIVSIGDYAFRDCDSLIDITIPSTVMRLGEGAFYKCDNLTTIKLPGKMVRIGDKAFYDCNSLKNITIPDGITKISDKTFMDCASITSITIPDDVTEIGKEVFCITRLTSITLPRSLTKIGRDTFSYLIGGLKDVYYQGTEEDFKKIDIDNGNEKLLKARIHYNSKGRRN